MTCLSDCCIVLRVQFVQPEVRVNEFAGVVQICVRKNLTTTEDITLDLQFQDGSAVGNQLKTLLCIYNSNYISSVLFSTSGA